MSLTDDWKAERLKKEKDYFVKTLSNGKIYPAHLYDDNSFSFCGNGTRYFPYGKQEIKVLAVCNYDHFVELTEKVKKFENDDLSAVITGCELEVNKLRELLKECKEYLSDVDEYFTKNADEATVLLTKIEEVLK